MKAADGIRRAVVVSAYHIGKSVLQDRLKEVPVAGPLFADVFGGLLEHVESLVFYENV